MQQDIEFYKALCSARLALGGSMKIADAGRMMKGFADANPKSYHYFEASETVGDLLVALRPVRSGGGILRPAGQRPWPDYKMRAGVDFGRALLSKARPARPPPHSTK